MQTALASLLSLHDTDKRGDLQSLGRDPLRTLDLNTIRQRLSTRL